MTKAPEYKLKAACIIPTYQGEKELPRLLDSLKIQEGDFDVFIVDSSSTDGTQKVAADGVTELKVIQSWDFNHGGTRQMQIDEHPGYEVYIFLTQDAELIGSDAIRKIKDPFKDSRVGAVCGRQLPHQNASLFAAHARLFNYPDKSRIYSKGDIAQEGLRAAFMSNSFAAYRATALTEVGGFPSDVIFGEDMCVAAKMLLNGWRIEYCAEAVCRHSHNYTIKEEFKRYFDIGVMHAQESWLLDSFGGAQGRGFEFAKSEAKFAFASASILCIESIFRSIAKIIAYKLGRRFDKLPTSFVRTFSMNKKYWKSIGGDH